MDFVDQGQSYRENGSNEKNPQYETVLEFFMPLREHWSAIQEILVWHNLGVAVVCFNIVNGLFWVFLSPCFRTCVGLAIVGSLLWLIPPCRLWVLSSIQTRKLSSKQRQRKHLNADSEDEMVDDSQQDTSEKKIASYQDFCHGIAVVWGFALKYYVKLKNMKDEKPQQFYALLALCVISLAIIYQWLPLGNILYLSIMFAFLWPAIVFHGIKDKFARKLQKLFKPFYTQWQNSQTKRKRNVTLKGTRDESDISDVEEEFNLNSRREAKKVMMGSVLPVERLREEIHHEGHFDSLNSSTISTDGLEFPSLRRDSVESYNSDDFIDGLNFGSFNVNSGSLHSSMDSLVGEQRKRDDAPPHDDLNEGENLETTATEVSPPAYVVEQVRSRRITNIEQSPSPLSRNKSSDSLQSYEIVETSEIDNVLATQSQEEPAVKEHSSYLASGAGYVGKLFGYS